MKPLTYLLLLACLLVTCESRQHYGRLVGQWKIVEIKSRGERLSLDELLESKQFTFTGRGKFWQGKRTTGISGRWRIVGDYLQLIQPELKGLNGKVVTSESQQEWALIVSQEWMIWRGTAKNSTQHLKIMLRKKQENTQVLAD